jgi:hypothetical protein
VIYWKKLHMNRIEMKSRNIQITILAVGLFLGLFSLFAEAADTGYEIAGGAGMSLSQLRSTQGIFLGAWIKRLSSILELRIEPNVEFIAAKTGQSLFFGGVSPVFRVSTRRQNLNPFLDAGVGVSIGSKTMFLQKNFGSNFFFSPMAGAGVKFGGSETGVSLFARWVHHSNAGLFPPNEGIDSLYVLLGCRF